MLVAQSCPTLCSPTGCSSPGSSVHGILQASHSLLQGIFLTQGWNPGLLHCRQVLYHLSHQGSLLKSTHLTPVVHRTVWKVLVNRTAFSLSPVNILGDTLGNYDLVVLSPRPRRSENTHRKLVVKPKLKLKAPTSLEWSPHNPTQPLSFRYFLGMAKRGSLGVNVTQEILILCDQVVITHLGF